MARRQRRDKQKTLAKAALFCCLHQAQAAVNVTVGKNLFFVPAHLPAQWTTALAPATSLLSE